MLLDGFVFGGFMCAAYLALAMLLFLSLGGAFFVAIFLHPVGLAVFFGVPTLWFGWVCYLHEQGRVTKAAPADARRGSDGTSDS
ncbi:MAG: hypothetical protein AAGD14_02855 [Planctomycetota bacterium]